MSQNKLVELCKKGDKQALSWLYQTYADKMKRICFHYVADRQIAQDLLHDGFIIIFTSINSLHSPDKLEYWMGTIMRNISLRYLKQCGSMSTVPLEEVSEDEVSTDTFPANDFPSYKTMLQMIDSLPEGYSTVFKLAVLEGLSHKEIGILLNIAPHSSSSQLSRAKELLRKLLSRPSIVIGLLLSAISIQIWLYTSFFRRTIVTEQNTSAVAADTRTILSQDYTPIPPTYTYRKPIRYITRQQGVVLKDSVTSVTEEKDSVNLSHHQIIEKQDQDTQKQKGYRSVFKAGQVSDKKNWTLAFAYSEGEKQTNIQRLRIPVDILSGHFKEIVERSYHHTPITLSLSLRKNINERWGIETGMQYTHLRSDFVVITDSYSEKTQKVSYIGIPFKGSFNIWGKKNFSLYTSTGITLDIPVKATLVLEERTSENGQVIYWEKSNLYPHLQWSADFGIGIQYHITPSFGIYAEPNLRYYFNNADRLNTIRTTKPFNVTLPIGIRLSW